MEYLVQISVRVPTTVAPNELAALTKAERERGSELQRSGIIKRIWRVPGTTDNVGIWSARDATDLHAAIASLPLFAFMSVTVTALAVHPLEG